MGLPVARVEVGVADGIATMEHPAIAHIDAHMECSYTVKKQQHKLRTAYPTILYQVEQ